MAVIIACTPQQWVVEGCLRLGIHSSMLTSNSLIIGIYSNASTRRYHVPSTQNLTYAYISVFNLLHLLVEVFQNTIHFTAPLKVPLLLLHLSSWRPASTFHKYHCKWIVMHSFLWDLGYRTIHDQFAAYHVINDFWLGMKWYWKVLGLVLRCWCWCFWRW